MARPKKFLASAAIAAGLLGGGVAGVVLGVPGVSGAQTTTTVPDEPSTTVPGDAERQPDADAHRPHRDRPRGDRPHRHRPHGDGDRENCPHKDGRRITDS